MVLIIYHTEVIGVMLDQTGSEKVSSPHSYAFYGTISEAWDSLVMLGIDCNLMLAYWNYTPSEG